MCVLRNVFVAKRLGKGVSGSAPCGILEYTG